jgi:hypothetical protein
MIRNTLRTIRPKVIVPRISRPAQHKPQMAANYITPKAKILAWCIFLVFFIEQGTLGLFPKQLYFLYRNVRISDFLIYGLIIYSFFNAKEYYSYYSSKLTIIIKVLLIYFLFHFIVSAISFDYNIVEYFFRLKGVWSGFMLFPFLLLMKRGGVNYLIKLIFPVAVVSNILYILSALTGIAFMPGLGIDVQNLPGGIQVFRVFGGTFYGEFFFLGFIFKWITTRFRVIELFPVILFIIPHILAFGRSAWVYFSFCILLMMLWNMLRKKDFKLLVRQIVIISLLGMAVIYTFTRFVPRADFLAIALQARVEQGKDDYLEETGTYGSRLANIQALIDLWYNSNVFFGIGMHPLWVVKPETVEESIYAWGFSDVKWASILAAYGITGIAIAIFYQIYYFLISFNIARKKKTVDLYSFFAIAMLAQLLFDSIINYSYNLFTLGLWGMSMYVAFLSASVIYSYVNLQNEEVSASHN